MTLRKMSGGRSSSFTSCQRDPVYFTYLIGQLQYLKHRTNRLISNIYLFSTNGHEVSHHQEPCKRKSLGHCIFPYQNNTSCWLHRNKPKFFSLVWTSCNKDYAFQLVAIKSSACARYKAIPYAWIQPVFVTKFSDKPMSALVINCMRDKV